MEEVAVGLRVVRGPQWEWEDQDGGEGTVGTVVATEEGGDALVEWDCGGRYRYKCSQDRLDLRVFDCAQAGVNHGSFECSWCHCHGIAGLLWRCAHCLDYFLCSQCYNSGRHSLEHMFERIDSADTTKRTRVSRRLSSRRVASRGVFPGATVMRGPDWRWDDQDGGLGKTGEVVDVDGWKSDSFRSVVKVRWTATDRENKYRLGHKGKVDVKCTTSEGGGRGGYYYPEHMPILGAPYEDPSERSFCAGDQVEVDAATDLLQLLQESHGGWGASMEKLDGRKAIVMAIYSCDDLRILADNGNLYQLHPLAVKKCGTPVFNIGQAVRVTDDMVLLHTLQQQPGLGWLDDMALALGQVGLVLRNVVSGSVLVRVNRKRWIFNPLSLISVPDSELPNNFEDEDFHVDFVSMLRALSNQDKPETIMNAIECGDVGGLKKGLEKFPDALNTLLRAGLAPIHVACSEGYLSVLTALLEYKPDVELMTERGDRPLHICANLHQEAATRLLIEAGANVNARSSRGSTPLMVASGFNSYRVVKALLDCPQIDISCLHSATGSSALYLTVQHVSAMSAILLMESGADPSKLHRDGDSPFHTAVESGLFPVVEYMVANYPQHIDTTNKDGWTPLHSAVINDLPDIVSYLAQQNSCNMEKTILSFKVTALHIAVRQGHSITVERLVGFGANVNATSSTGETPLHYTMARKNAAAPDCQSPRLRKIQSSLASDCPGQYLEPYIAVACFLVQEGASLDLKNKSGQTPLFFCPPEVASVVTGFIKKHGAGSFHGSLRSTEGAYLVDSDGDQHRSGAAACNKMDSSQATDSKSEVKSPS